MYLKTIKIYARTNTIATIYYDCYKNYEFSRLGMIILFAPL